MAELTTFGVAIQSDAAKRGAEEVSASLGKISSAASESSRRMEAFQQELAATRQRADALAAVNTAAANTTVAAGNATTQASRKYGELGRVLIGTAAQTAGLDATSRRLLTTLSSLAIGGGMAVAVGAGLSLIGGAIKDARDRADEARKPLEDLIARLQALNTASRKEELGAVLDLANIRQAAIEAAAELAEVRRQQDNLGGTPTGDSGLLFQIGRSIRERVLGGRAADAERASLEAQRAQQALVNKMAADKEKADREAAERAEREHDAELRRLKALQAERARAAKEELEADQRRLRSLQAIYDQLLRNVPNGFGVSQLGDSAQRRRGAELIGQGNTPLPRGQIFGGGETGIVAGILRRQREAEDADLRARQEQIDAMDHTRRAALNLVDALGVLPENLLRVGDAALRTLNDLEQRRAKDSSAGLTTGNVLDLAAVGVGLVGSLISARRQAELEAARLKAAQADFSRTLSRFTESIYTQSPLQRELNGLRDTFANLADQAAKSRNILISGDSSGYNAETVAARQLEIQREISNLSSAGAARRLDGLLAELAYLGDIEKILAASAEAEAELRRQSEARFEADQRRIKGGLAVELLEASGQGGAAELLALQQRQAERFAEAWAAGFDQVTLDMLNSLAALQQAALLFRQETDAIARNNETNDINLTTRSRELALEGRTSDAQELDLQIAAIGKLEEAERLRREGLIDEELYIRLVNLAHGELAQGLQDLADAAAEAAEAAAAAVAARRDDLEVQLLAAQGLDAEADARRRWLQYQRDLADATDAGIQALITLVYVTNEQRLANLAAADALREYEEALRDQADFVTDLVERELRATGFTDAADESALLQRQADEIRRAIEEGRTADQIAEIKRVQAIERQAADDARRARQEDAFNRATAAPGEGALAASPTSVNLAVGISETTGNRIAGLMLTAVGYQSYLPRIYDELRGMRLLSGAGTTGVSFDALDQGLAQAASDAAADAGWTPGANN